MAQARLVRQSYTVHTTSDGVRKPYKTVRIGRDIAEDKARAANSSGRCRGSPQTDDFKSYSGDKAS
jgi:hypothetical protein